MARRSRDAFGLDKGPASEKLLTILKSAEQVAQKNPQDMRRLWRWVCSYVNYAAFLETTFGRHGLDQSEAYRTSLYTHLNERKEQGDRYAHSLMIYLDSFYPERYKTTVDKIRVEIGGLEAGILQLPEGIRPEIEKIIGIVRQKIGAT